MSRRTVIAALALTACLLLTACLGRPARVNDPRRNADATTVTLTIASNAIEGGKNSAIARWITDYVIPTFTARQRANGVTVHLKFQGSGADDGSYQQKQILQLRTGGGGDVLDIDGTDIGNFAQSWLIEPLAAVVGAETVAAWDGWSQIYPAVRQLEQFRGQDYGIPKGTDGRVLFYNRELFARAGLPTEWQPRSWDEILGAAAALAKLPGVTPMQLDGGTAMAETTTINGFLPLLAGAGALIHAEGKWQGNTAAMRAALGFYQRLVADKLIDPNLNLEAQGRDRSFAEFAAGRIGIYLESDYLWRSIISPSVGTNPMPERDTTIGYALIPAMRPGAGVDGKDVLTFSGGAVWLINPNTDYPQQAWSLLTFMSSAEAMIAYQREYLGSAQIMPRTDVNDALLASEPLMRYIATKALPHTYFRPAEAAYTRVSALIQQATADVISGGSPETAAATYARELAEIVGRDNVAED
ncbi:extracellular solute-binding protein [Nocardia sp. CDC159]|uniref:Extracellular solute-binding protein n=1 Tax=Nocardia pulmonis TaxID=2951408 RepID=A0A9X2E6K9_9NOCA|nr:MULTISPECIES: extracellular solute-binding protein [Nocardia]MCM6774590.1 extracellular solute-binding protein [Nocardia pulmonis]MCM6787345.1 extracellular solute-binding protein [Nocardia sp. CDC159]